MISLFDQTYNPNVRNLAWYKHHTAQIRKVRTEIFHFRVDNDKEFREKYYMKLGLLWFNAIMTKETGGPLGLSSFTSKVLGLDKVHTHFGKMVHSTFFSKN